MRGERENEGKGDIDGVGWVGEGALQGKEGN